MCIEKKMEPFKIWRIKENLQKSIPTIAIHWSDDRWKACLAAGGGNKKGDSSTVLIVQEQLCISELFKDIQDAILVDPSLQDNVIIQSNFFQYKYHVGCAFQFAF